MPAVRCLLLAWACALACTPVLASRSSVGDESDVGEPGDCELELVGERTRARSGPLQRERALRLACSVGGDTELEVAHARRRSGAERDQALSLEAKTTLRDRRQGRVGWAVVLGVAADRADGAWRRSEHGAALEATRQLGQRWLVEARLGTSHDVPSRRNSTLWTLGVEHALHERLELRAELDGDDRGRPWARLGLRYVLWPEHLQLKLAQGWRRGAQRESSTSLGLQLDF